jgi:hypothetical protein
MALPTRVAVNSDPFAEQDEPLMTEVEARARMAPVPWRVGRILAAFTLVLVGLAMVLVTLALVWWPGLIIVCGFGLAAGGAFFVRIEPGPPKR